jgi:hypothetical protein
VKWAQAVYARNDWSWMVSLSLVACVLLILIGCLALVDDSGTPALVAERSSLTGGEILHAEPAVLADDQSAIAGVFALDRPSALQATSAPGEARPWLPSYRPIGIERLAHFTH